MSHSRVRELRDQAIDAVKELYHLHNDIDHEILQKVLGDVIIETEYSVLALKDTPVAGEEPVDIEPEAPKRRRGVRRKKA